MELGKLRHGPGPHAGKSKRQARRCREAKNRRAATRARNGNASIASRPSIPNAPRHTDSCRAARSFRRVLGLVIEYVIGPRLIADHVVSVIGRLVSGWPAGAGAGRYGGDRPVDLRVAKK